MSAPVVVSEPPSRDPSVSLPAVGPELLDDREEAGCDGLDEVADRLVEAFWVVTMPGLLQTSDHARASYVQGVPPLHPYEIEHRAAFRVRRQGVLHRDSPLPYTAIIHEAALRMGVGGPEVVRAQLHHLNEMGERDNVRILAIPFEQAGFPASGQPITYACGPVSQLDTVLLDSDHGCDLLFAEAQLSRYRAVLDRMERCALGAGKSRDFIHKIAKSL